MIQNFKCKETQKVWNLTGSRKFPPDIQETGRRKLKMLNNAKSLEDLRVPPGNKLKRLSGKRQNEYSIRINDQWRVLFCWESGNPYDVAIDDIH